MMGSAEQQKRIEQAMAEFPAVFGLRGNIATSRFRISTAHSYVNDSNVVMLYTEILSDGKWLSYCKGTVEELRKAVIALPELKAEIKQPIEVLKFSRMGLSAVTASKQGIARVAGHVKQAKGSFRKAVQHPLSENAAKSLVEVDRALERLMVALDTAAIDLTYDEQHYRTRIAQAEPLALAEIARTEVK